MAWAASAALVAPTQVSDLNDAINKAGRQRMLSQRMASKATELLAQDAKVLALIHKGTELLEQMSGKPVGKLVNMAGRQRMAKCWPMRSGCYSTTF